MIKAFFTVLLIIGGFIVLAAVATTAIMWQGQHRVSGDVGKEGILFWPDGKPDDTIPVATSWPTFSEFKHTAEIHDIYGLKELYRSKQIWNEKAGTRVLVLDLMPVLSDSVTYEQVRFLSGDHQGETGWVWENTFKTDDPKQQSAASQKKVAAK